MTETERPNPDELLADVQRKEARARRGRLRVFFGASAGVGKTYSMLESARAARAGGADIVAGYVEPHGRAETERLLDGLEQLPFLEVRYRGITRREFDLDAALRRAPGIVLVDELAHSNIADGEPRPRHAKRWQDVEELLNEGIGVWTTLNVQHLESLNDVVAGITGVRQQETIPDRIFDEADEVELIDLPPDDLLARLKAGKVYAKGQAATATERFFRKPNLLALRELALRRTADRVDAAAQEFAGEARSSRPWLARDRFLIAVAPDDQAEQLVRVGKRFADALDAEWMVVSVETPTELKLSETERNRRIDVLRLAESLGAVTVTLGGPSAAEVLIEYARLRNVTRIVVGEAKRRGWRAWMRRSTATELVRRGAGFDISVIARRDARAPRRPELPTSGPTTVRWDRYWAALLISALCTGARRTDVPVFRADQSRHGLPARRDGLVGPAWARTGESHRGSERRRVRLLLRAAAVHICRQRRAVPGDFRRDAGDGAGHCQSRRKRARADEGRRRSGAPHLVAVCDEPGIGRDAELRSLARVAVKHVAETFASHAVVLMPDALGRLHHPRGEEVAAALQGADLSVAQWVFDHGRPAGLGTDTLPAAAAQYLPLTGTRRTLGVLAVGQPSGADCCYPNSATSSRPSPARSP